MDVRKLAGISAKRGYYAAAAVAAIAAGVGVGFLVDRLCREKTAEERFEEIKDELGFVEVPVEETLRPRGNMKVSPSFEKPDISNMVDYTKFFPRDVTEVVSVNGVPVVEVNGHDRGPAEKEDNSMLDIISEEEFVKLSGNLDGYVTATGTFFPDNGVLAGWNDSLEPKDIATTIGDKAAAMFEDESVGAVYVRNKQLKVLYEVIRGDGLYGPEE